MKQAALVMVVGVVLGAGVARGAPVVSVDVDPGTAGVQGALSIGTPSQFRIDIAIQGVEASQPLNAFEFDLDFDPQVTKAISVSDGGFLLNPVFQLQNNVGSLTVEFAEVSLVPGGAVGDGVLASILFETTGEGTSALDLNDVILSAPFGIPIPTAATRDGRVAVAVSPIPEPSAALLFLIGGTITGRAIVRHRRARSRSA